MSNRIVFTSDFDWVYNFVSIADQTQKFLRYDYGTVFTTTSGHVDSAHDDGATVTYRSYVIRDFSLKGQLDYYTSLSKAIGVYYVDVCCFVVHHLYFTGLGSGPINTKELPIYSRSSDIVVYERYKTTRVPIGQTPLVSGYNDVVCDSVRFNLKTRKNIVLNPNDRILMFCAVYTNKQYSGGGEQVKVVNTVFDVRYDAN